MAYNPDPTFIRRGVTKSGIPYTVIRMSDGRELVCKCFEALRQRRENDLAHVNRERLTTLPIRHDLRQSKGSVSYGRQRLKLVQ